MEVSSFNMIPHCGVYEVEVLAKEKRFRSICYIMEIKDRDVAVEMDIPKHIKIDYREEVTIKWLNEWSVESSKMLQSDILFLNKLNNFYLYRGLLL
ncbi:hypothetical protein [Neobacillus drentensis]|uniref:hypothetical protein n=1 Tax=Neobacillus drentensis TaxID=220684 RepID=UPI003003748A